MHERWEHRRSYFLQCCEARVDSITMVVRRSECPFSNVPQVHARKSQAFGYLQEKEDNQNSFGKKNRGIARRLGRKRRLRARKLGKRYSHEFVRSRSRRFHTATM